MNQAERKKYLNRLENSSINYQNTNFESSRTLPLLSKLKKIFKELNLKNTLIISVQHLCSTTELLFDALIEAKLAPKNLYILGKCYSTNPAVFHRLIKKDIKVSFLSSVFNNSLPFDISFDQNILEMLNQIMNELDLYSFEKIIILDDGGHLIEKVNKYFPKNLPIIAIEQTSSGFNRIKIKDVSFPIINLARSWLKLEKESPIIVDLILKKLYERLSRINSYIENILIIGYGVLGQAIYKALREKYLVSVFDSNPQKSEIALLDFKKRLPEFDLIIGCTGNTSLFYKDYRFLKRPVILASISSSDREFEAHELRKYQSHENCHENVELDGISLLNCGFPITFDKDYDSIDTEDFQLTRSLIFASIYQASFTDSLIGEFIDLRKNLQKIILKEMDNL